MGLANAILTARQKSVGANSVIGTAGDATIDARRIGVAYRPYLARGIVSGFNARIASAGGTISLNDLDRLQEPLEALIRSSVWAKLAVLWVPMGDQLAASLVPIIGNNFTVGGTVTYTQTTGVTGDGTTGYINTNYNPNTAGLSATNYGLGVYVTKITLNGIVAGTASGLNTFIGASGVGQVSSINGISSGANGGPQSPRLCSAQVNGANAEFYVSGYKTATVAGSGAIPNSSLTVLSPTSPYFSTQTAAGFAVWKSALTQAEMVVLVTFFDAINTALMRNSYQPSLVAVGDSNTVGFGLGSPTTERWSALLAGSLGLTDDNRAVSGTCMSDNPTNVPIVSAGNWVTSRKIDQTIYRAGLLLAVCLGTNDDRCGVPIADYAADYETWLNYQLTAGTSTDQILLLSQPYTTDAASTPSRQEAQVAAVAGLAKKYNIGYFDLYNASKSTFVAADFQADYVHFSAAGHAKIYSLILQYIGTTYGSAVLRRIPW